MKGHFFQQDHGMPNEKDYSRDYLPHTRMELLRTAFLVRRDNLTAYSLIYTIPWIPAIAWTAIMIFRLFAVLNQTETVGGSQIQSIVFLYTVVMFPLITVTGPFTLAGSYVMRNWARDEQADLTLDYRYALKENWKQGLMFGVTNGLIVSPGILLLNFYLARISTSALYFFSIIFIMILMLFWQLCCLVIPTMCVTYRIRYHLILRNAVFISFMQLFRATGIWLITECIPIAAVVVCATVESAFIWAPLIAVVFQVVLGFGISKMISASYANMVCEKYINSKIEGAPVDIGLH